MVKDLLTPDYIFESSWEVCNKVGGIYTVLSTRANTLQEKFRDRIFFIGPDVWQGKENPLFIESDNLCAAWKTHALENDHLSVRIGRWNIPGEPIVILVDFQPFFEKKNDIYTEMWNRFQVDSLHAYGDYDEASMFSYAAGRVVESFYRYNLTETDKVVYQAHEWMTGMGALYVQEAVPEVATIFTTHATSIGRSIAGNHKPLYDYLFAYNGDQMAQELNMQSKHSIEKQTAHHVDCFTTVSEITNNECKELLDKPADVVLMKSRLSDVPAAVRLSRATLRNIHENLFWAFFYNIIGIPLAAGVWIPIFGWTLNPMFGALAMSLSSFCVVSNALRLNLFKVKDSHRDHKIKNEVTLPQWEASKGEKNMTKTMTIKGMMCGHCEARVKKTLEELEHVTEAQASHEKGTAVVSMETEVADEVLKKAVEDQGYQVENIQ